MGQSGNSNSACTRKELVKKIRKVLDHMENADVEPGCCCADTARPGPGRRVVTAACLDGAPALRRVVPVHEGRTIWVPPPVDTRPPLDPSMSCYAATVANRFYDRREGCRLECASAPHSHWWNEPRAARRPNPGSNPDYCQDPTFVPPEPLGHMAWTGEPGGSCRYPQYCKAHCFDHTPARDWART